MTREDFDWPVVRLSFIIFTVLLLISTTLVTSSWIFKKDMLKEYTMNKSRFNAISQKYLSVDEDEEIVRQYYPEFIALYKQGFVGREQRLNWIETLLASSERVKLPGLSYSIFPQEAYSPGFSINLGRFALYSSVMKLNISMLHEGDLLRLIKDMNEHVQGMFIITECNFKRASRELIERRDATNITANCELQWLNIRLADGTAIKLS
jgi:hypothetical protein